MLGNVKFLKREYILILLCYPYPSQLFNFQHLRRPSPFQVPVRLSRHRAVRGGGVRHGRADPGHVQAGAGGVCHAAHARAAGPAAGGV